MKRALWIGTLLSALVLAGRARCGEPCPDGFLKPVGPVGGWCPYGGGLLRWWDPHCFPDCCGPDDYCRKKLPCVCWPPYPPYYVWGPPETCHPSR